MRLSPRCIPGSPGAPPQPQAFDESDRRIDGAGRNVPARPSVGRSPAADSRTDRDGVSRESDVCHCDKPLRGESAEGGTTLQYPPAPKEVAARPAARFARTPRTMPARGRAQMHGNGLGRGDGRPAESVKAEPQIQVGAVEGEAFVEATRLRPGGTPIRIGAASGRDKGRRIAFGLLERPA